MGNEPIESTSNIEVPHGGETPGSPSCPQIEGEIVISDGASCIQMLAENRAQMECCRAPRCFPESNERPREVSNPPQSAESLARVEAQGDQEEASTPVPRKLC